MAKDQYVVIFWGSPLDGGWKTLGTIWEASGGNRFNSSRHCIVCTANFFLTASPPHKDQTRPSRALALAKMQRDAHQGRCEHKNDKGVLGMENGTWLPGVQLSILDTILRGKNFWPDLVVHTENDFPLYVEHKTLVRVSSSGQPNYARGPPGAYQGHGELPQRSTPIQSTATGSFRKHPRGSPIPLDQAQNKTTACKKVKGGAVAFPRTRAFRKGMVGGTGQARLLAGSGQYADTPKIPVPHEEGLSSRRHQKQMWTLSSHQ
ncbi:hypothetical protein GWK47_037387 [Chionoecetes opilio]|uniref:Uncharacterized protein n=1 Tax=Chionoecetes opilio TaxID=41210 RepID=A0A8J4YDH1_CHIOP|nr:hypothetical protein GWK47_037387 [Chionoecetes opilio]